MLQDNLYIITIFIAGMVFGALFVWFIFKLTAKRGEDKFNAALDEATALLKSNFAEISLDTLAKTTDMLSGRLKSEREISAKEISGQKEVIEKRIDTLNGELLKLTGLINNMENSRNMQMGELKSIIDDSRAKTRELFNVTNGLKETLSSKQGRGQWAERMADDVLNYAGLKEGINYIRQQKSDVTGKRPDFTFLLPNGTTLNMDVKFPYDNYKRYMESPENEKPYYAILTDVQMEDSYSPKYAGEWLVEQIKTFSRYNNTKVIMISATYNIRHIAETLGVYCIPKSTALKCISAYEGILLGEN